MPNAVAPANPTVADLEALARAAEVEERAELAAACRRLVLERRVGRLGEPPRGDEQAGDVRDLCF